MGTRQIELTHEEIETIKTALQFVYDTKLKCVKDNRKTLGEELSKEVMKVADKFFDTQEVFDGERDR